MTGNQSDQDDGRSGRDRRKLPRSRSIYKWNFDPSGNWWKEKRRGEERRERVQRRRAPGRT